MIETLNYFLRQESPSPSSPPFEGPPETDPKASSKSIHASIRPPRIDSCFDTKRTTHFDLSRNCPKIPHFPNTNVRSGIAGPRDCRRVSQVDGEGAGIYQLFQANRVV